MAIIIIDNYDSFTFNLFQLLQANTAQEVIVIRNDKISFPELVAKTPSGIVLSPGPGHPAVEADFGVCKDIIQNAAAIACPVLGVCLGHQGIAQHLGGSVVTAPQIVHGKTSTVTITASSPLLSGIDRNFQAMRYHSLIVDDKILPGCLAVTAREQNHGLIMALQHVSLPLYGLQFHPESIGTPAGEKIASNFLNLCKAR